MDGTVILGRLGITVAKVAGRDILKFLINETKGKRFLFLGPSWSGKTSFWKFIRTGEYANPSLEREHTPRDKNLGRLEISSSNNRVQIEVKRTYDIKGTKTPDEQARLIRTRKPDAICVLVEANRKLVPTVSDNPADTITGWLELLLQSLYNERENYPDNFSKLKSIVFIVNKADLMSSGLEISRIKTSIEGLISRFRTGCLSKLLQNAKVIEMSMLRSYKSGESPGKALSTLISPFL